MELRSGARGSAQLLSSCLLQRSVQHAEILGAFTPTFTLQARDTDKRLLRHHAREVSGLMNQLLNALAPPKTTQLEPLLGSIIPSCSALQEQGYIDLKYYKGWSADI